MNLAERMVFSMKRSFKQLLALVCTLALLASFTTAFAAANQFTDVPSAYWAHNEIAFVVDKGLFNGTTATQFSPDAQMKRGQLAAVLYRYAGSPAVSGTSGYTDVASTAYYADACAWAKQNGIFMADKLDAASLNPDEGITRSEFAVMLYNFAKLNGKADVDNSAENPYTDMTNVSSEIKTAIINWAVPAGILGGTTDTTMNPFGAIKRSHVAAMLYHYDTKIANPGSVVEKPEETTPSTSETTSYGPGDTVAPVKGGAYTVTIGVGEKCYMDATKMGADWIEHYVNQFSSNGHQIAEVPWDSSVNKSAIIGKVPGTMTIECLSTADYKTVFATIKVTVTSGSSTSSGNSGSTGNTGSTTGDLDANMAIREEIVRLTNEVREENGVAALPVDDALMNAAQRAAEEYTTRLSTWSGHDVKMEAEMLRAEGINYSGGANLAREFGSGLQVAESAIDSWINSPGHFAAMIDSDFNNIGVGVAQAPNGIWVCVQFFGDLDTNLGIYT